MWLRAASPFSPLFHFLSFYCEPFKFSIETWLRCLETYTHTHKGTHSHMHIYICIFTCIYLYIQVSTVEPGNIIAAQIALYGPLQYRTLTRTYRIFAYFCLLLFFWICLPLFACIFLALSAFCSVWRVAAAAALGASAAAAFASASVAALAHFASRPPGAQNLGHSTICWPNRTIALVSHSSCFHLPLCLSLYSSFCCVSLCVRLSLTHTHTHTCVQLRLSLFSLAQAVAFISRFPTLFLINAGRCDWLCVCAFALRMIYCRTQSINCFHWRNCAQWIMSSLCLSPLRSFFCMPLPDIICVIIIISCFSLDSRALPLSLSLTGCFCFDICVSPARVHCALRVEHFTVVDPVQQRLCRLHAIKTTPKGVRPEIIAISTEH